MDEKRDTGVGSTLVAWHVFLTGWVVGVAIVHLMSLLGFGRGLMRASWCDGAQRAVRGRRLMSDSYTADR